MTILALLFIIGFAIACSYLSWPVLIGIFLGLVLLFLLSSWLILRNYKPPERSCGISDEPKYDLDEDRIYRQTRSR